MDFFIKKGEFSESPKRFRSLSLTDLLLDVGAGVAQAFLKMLSADGEQQHERM